jgi:hypothetical protein
MKMDFETGNHVRVAGARHPHRGREGRITEILGVLVPIGQPRAMIRLADEPGVIIVGLEFLQIVHTTLQGLDSSGVLY